MSFGFHCRETGFTYAGNDLNGVFSQQRQPGQPPLLAVPPRDRPVLPPGRGRPGRRRRPRHPGRLPGAPPVPAVHGGQLPGAHGGGHLVDPGRPGDRLPGPLLPALLQEPRPARPAPPAALADRERRQPAMCAFATASAGAIRLDSPAAGPPADDGVELAFADRSAERFDAVVVAAHADQALRLLADPSAEESRLLGAWRYELNTTVLHTDTSVLPPAERAWACWNFRRERGDQGERPVYVTYPMNLLQGLATRRHYLVTLNRPGGYDEGQVLARMDYHHPLYTDASMATQAALPRSTGCAAPGSAAAISVTASTRTRSARPPGRGPSAGRAMNSRLYTGELRHTRSRITRHEFSYPLHLYALDLDEVDALADQSCWFGHNRIRPIALHDRDYLHPGTAPAPGQGLPGAARAWPGHGAGASRAGHRPAPVPLRVQPGQLFLPDAAGQVFAVLVQVNNTFGDTHLYCLPGEADRPATDKVFHVSPFFPRTGSYRFHLTPPGGDTRPWPSPTRSTASRPRRPRSPVGGGTHAIDPGPHRAPRHRCAPSSPSRASSPRRRASTSAKSCPFTRPSPAHRTPSARRARVRLNGWAGGTHPVLCPTRPRPPDPDHRRRRSGRLR